MKIRTGIHLITFAVGLMAAINGNAMAAVVYELSGPGDDLRQQTGNNVYYYGDDVTLLNSQPQRLDSITLLYGLYAEDASISYTPDLSLDIFAINPTTRVPFGSILGTATRNDVTFAGGLSNNLPLNPQSVTFDFTGQNIILPTDFAFVYRDNSPASTVPPASGFSVFLRNSGPPTLGSTIDGFIDATPNSSIYQFRFGANGVGTAGGNLVATIQATAVPEPSMLSMGLVIAAIGVGFAFRQRKASAA